MDLFMMQYWGPSLILICVVVLPLWIIMHYATKNKVKRGLSSQEQDELELLAIAAERMEDRIENLEAILDEQTPEWRKRTRENISEYDE
ncbi:MAG: envelope stress response membrane protein PspB [Gammaproteobacteria bacterium]|nr:envelope stress response membrane protein PspB [Gammaproteobacteria bacterium]